MVFDNIKNINVTSKIMLYKKYNIKYICVTKYIRLCQSYTDFFTYVSPPEAFVIFLRTTQ
jgi:hypothetical protein